MLRSARRGQPTLDWEPELFPARKPCGTLQLLLVPAIDRSVGHRESIVLRADIAIDVLARRDISSSINARSRKQIPSRSIDKHAQHHTYLSPPSARALQRLSHSQNANSVRQSMSDASTNDTKQPTQPHENPDTLILLFPRVSQESVLFSSWNDGHNRHEDTNPDVQERGHANFFSL